MPESQTAGSGPVGTGERKIQSGECVISIAEATGHFWEKLWKHPDNETLKQVRKDPNVLLAGDLIHVPEIEPKDESGATEVRHRFRRRGVPSILRLRILREGEPVANTPFVLDVDGTVFEGSTTSQGDVEQAIPCGARRGELRVGSGSQQLIYTLSLGGMDPIETITGQKARLNNLGYAAGSENEEETPAFESALRKFQKDHELERSGKPDSATLNKLRELTS